MFVVILGDDDGVAIEEAVALVTWKKEGILVWGDFDRRPSNHFTGVS